MLGLCTPARTTPDRRLPQNPHWAVVRSVVLCDTATTINLSVLGGTNVSRW